jgi:hypothetical protein
MLFFDGARQGRFVMPEFRERKDMTPSLITDVRDYLQALPDRERDVGLKRLGFAGRAPTLQQMGEVHGVRGEAIRQMEARICHDLRRQHPEWWERLALRLDALRQERTTPLPLREVEDCDPWLTGVCEHPCVLRYLAKQFCKRSIEIVTIADVAYLAGIRQSYWNDALVKAHQLLRSNGRRRAARGGEGRGLTEADCRILVEGLLPERGAELRGMLWDQVASLCRFDGGADERERVLVAFTGTLAPARRQPMRAEEAGQDDR